MSNTGSVISKRSSVSSRSLRAKLAADAAAAKARAEIELNIVKKERIKAELEFEIRELSVKGEADVAEISLISFEKALNKAETMLQERAKLTANDRVNAYCAGNGLATGVDLNFVSSCSDQPSTSAQLLFGVNTTMQNVTTTAATDDVNPLISNTDGFNHYVAISSHTSVQGSTNYTATTSYRSLPTVTSGITSSPHVNFSSLPSKFYTNSTPARNYGGARTELVDTVFGSIMHETIPPPLIDVPTPAPTSHSQSGATTIAHDLSEQLEFVMSECAAANLKVAEALVKSQLPPVECDVFDGNPLTYTRWKRSVLTQLNVKMPPTERLTRLSKLVTGEAETIVIQYSDRFPDHAELAYKKAWEKLDHWFGRNSVIAKAALNRLSAFEKPGYDPKKFREFSDLCESVALQMPHLPGLKVLDFPMYLKPIVGRLPESYQRKWTDHAYRIIKQRVDRRPPVEYPEFEDFSTFVSELADKLCDPDLQLSTPALVSTKRANASGESDGPSVESSFASPPDTSNQDQTTTSPQNHNQDMNRETSRNSEQPIWFCPIHPDQSHGLSRCFTFKRKSTEEKVKIMKTSGKDLCRSCLRLGHDSTDCTIAIKCIRENCSKKHFGFMHDASEILRANDRTSHSYAGKEFCNSISPVQTARCVDLTGNFVNCNVLHDTGSNISLIRSDRCAEFGLNRCNDEERDLSIEVIGGDCLTVKACKYEVPLFANADTPAIMITAYGIDNIGSKIPSVDLTVAAEIFGLSPSDSLQYPGGSIDILIGTDNAHLGLHRLSEINGLVLSETLLGKLIWGKHPSFKSPSSARGATTVPSWILQEKSDPVANLFSTELLGISCSPKCGSCACKKCPIDGSDLTPQEKYEYQQIKNSMELRDGVITASYPYIRDIADLPNNYELALRRLIQTEKSLRRDPDRAKKYQEQFDDMLQRGVMRKLEPEEESSWTGAVQYLPHNDVQKPGSESTPVRMVLDPSAQYKGKAVNQFWGRGPSLLNDPTGILIRFREEPTALAGDISKMYWQVHTTPREWHLHRLLWRNMDDSRPPDKYIIVRNSFGSGPSGCVAIAAKNLLAELKSEKYPEASRIIIEQAFVDDILDSTSTESEARRLTSEVDEILAQGNFKIKHWTIVNRETQRPVVSDNQTVQIGVNEVGSSVLGISWDTNTDEFFFEPCLNFSKKRKKLRTGPDLEPGEIFDTSIVPHLTKRSIMSQVHSLYDPLGLISPFVVELKFALGKLWRLKDQLDWDTPIPDEHDAHWRKLLELFFQIGHLRFPRLLHPSTAISDPVLVAFSDSSMIAYGAAIYVTGLWMTVGSFLAS